MRADFHFHEPHDPGTNFWPAVLVEGAQLEITEGSNAEEELTWALAHADRIDPLTSWRTDIERVKAEGAGRPCPKCGTVHGASREGEGRATRAPPDEASSTSGDTNHAVASDEGADATGGPEACA